MKINSEDCYIEYRKGIYYLFIPKSKKNLKEEIVELDKEEIIEAIVTVENGKPYFSFEAGKIYKATTEKRIGLPVLSKREKEILKLIAEGLTNIEISKQLFISIDTVDTHNKNLYTKLNVKNTALLIRQAIENNYL